MEDLVSRLLSVKGMGEGRLERLRTSFGGSQGLEKVLNTGDVSALSSLDGVSERMAVELILASKGSREKDIEGNEPVSEILSQVHDLLSSCMHTSRSRNRVLLLRPGGDLSSNMVKAKKNHSMVDLLEGKDRARIDSLLKRIARTSSRRKRKGSLQYILVVEDDEAYEGIKEKGLDRTCLVIPPEDLSEMLEGTVILVHNKREIDEEMLPISASVHYSRPAYEIVPEVLLEELLPLRDRFQAVAALREIFSMGSKCSEMIDLLDDLAELQGSDRKPEEIRSGVEEIKNEINSSLKDEISKLTLSGEDAISILSSEEPLQLRKIYTDHSKLAADMVRERLSIRADIFKMRYPVEVDEEVLDRIISSLAEKALEEMHREKVNRARKMEDIRKEVLGELEWAMDLDFDIGMACFVKDLDLHPFEISRDGISIEGAADVLLRKGKEYQEVDYHLGSGSSRTALLTGANSGGKTTLLMTVAQIELMAYMGLPVPARRASIPPIDKIFIYRPKRKMDAGGLEAFLSELLPMSLDVDERSLVLADELEAMTELEAASRIIGAFVDELQKRGAYSIIVTHMADEIMKYVDCRIDGIEARGLDDRFDLIVDRTPRIGHQARSTPELIIRRLKEKARGKEKEVYTKVLESFQR